MSWLIYLFGSGAAFFLGASLIIAATSIRALTGRKWLGSLTTLSTLVGLVLAALSATPLPYAFYLAAAGITLAWLFAEESSRQAWQRHRTWLRAAAAAVWVLGALMELPYHFAPSVRAADPPTLYLLGDSVAAGLGDRGVETWPRLLARSHGIDVRDFSQAGAKTATALRQAEQLPAGGGLVLLEIGGNDLLGSTSAVKFEQDLERLLDRVCAPGRVVVMFELPLPPFANEYGRAQRRVASRHGVALIPKRVFISVLTADGATLDSIHLARSGHERMAEAVWAVIRPAYLP
jgi:acyl-CoA thioesterase-1